MSYALILSSVSTVKRIINWTAIYVHFGNTVLQTWVLSARQKKEPYIGFTQENSVQDYLPYILVLNGLCELFLAYLKWPCICLKDNICITCCMISSLPEYSTSFFASCGLGLCHLMWHAVWRHDILNSNPNSKF